MPATQPRSHLHAVALGLAGCLLAAGCGRDADIRPGDIRVYTVPAGAEPPAVVAARDPRPAAGDRRISYEVPESWTDRGASGMRLATLLIGDPADALEVTVIPASGTLESNVDRWQGQLAPQATAAEREQAARKAIAEAETVDAAGTTATVVLLTAPQAGEAKDTAADTGEAILGAMIPVADDAALFVKFKGDAAVARRERDNFVRFVSSIRWNN